MSLKNLYEKVSIENNYLHYDKSETKGKEISNKDLNFLKGDYINWYLYKNSDRNKHINFFDKTDSEIKDEETIQTFERRLATEEVLQIEFIRNLSILLFENDIYTNGEKTFVIQETVTQDHQDNLNYIKTICDRISFENNTIGYMFHQLLINWVAGKDLENAVHTIEDILRWKKKWYESVKEYIEEINHNIYSMLSN